MFNFMVIISALLLHAIPINVTQISEDGFMKSDYSILSQQPSNTSMQTVQRVKRSTTCEKLKGKHYMVSLRRKSDKKHVCAGSVISPRWILTAAYCFTTDVKPDVAIFGLARNRPTRDSDLKQHGDFWIGIGTYIQHDKFDSKKMINDIALVGLLDAIDMAKDVTPVQLAHDKADDLSKACDAGSFINLVWQDVTVNLDVPPNEWCYQSPYLTNDKCAKKFQYINDNIMCTSVEAPEGTWYCTQHIGSPLFCNEVQYGVVSYADGCEHFRAPTYYSRVDRYTSFITHTLANRKPNHQPRPTSALFIILLTQSILMHFCVFHLFFLAFW